MKVALVLNGDEPSKEELKLLDACEKVVCADGAAACLLKAERPPSIIVGDMDSLPAEVYKWAEALEIPLERHTPQKDETDGELGLRRALDLGAKSLIILGGHGGRMAMFLGNLKLLRRAHDRGLEASMIGNGESIRYVTAGQELSLPGREGATLNLLSVDGDAMVSVKGAQWAGERLLIARSASRGLSNRITSDGAQVTVHEGVVLAIVERAPRPRKSA